MTPQEKAVELVEQFLSKIEAYVDGRYHQSVAKKLALIAVDEILEAGRKEFSSAITFEFWTEVKNQINLL